MTQCTTEEGRLLKEIETMSRIEMAHLLRFAPSGHPIFSNAHLYERFKARWDMLGGWTPELGKLVGWKKSR